MWCQNPVAFRPGPVTFWTTAIYLAIAIPLIFVHETVPPAPANHSIYRDINLDEAWKDLQNVTAAFHPYNSHNNDEVRGFYIARVKEMLDKRNVTYTTDRSGGVPWHMIPSLNVEDPSSSKEPQQSDKAKKKSVGPSVTLFDDEISNVTWTSSGSYKHANESQAVNSAHYFEGNNFYVYIRGTDDPPGEWWHKASYRSQGPGGVLVNCHLDSVSTGYGATDNGIACVTLLQLLSYFTGKDRQPKNGIVLLFNNAEEDGLLGALAFGYSPLLPFLHTFVNLEGAGAGGRAILFRTTDLQAAKAYSHTPHPFGSIVADDAFSAGYIKSRTDFEVWHESYGQRGLDIAFYAPRSRYHTDQDDTRHTSINSVWHMVAAALATTKQLSQTTGTIFHGKPPNSSNKKLINAPFNGKLPHGIWFDLFGNVWAVFALRGLFAWTLTLLVAAPLILLVVSFMLGRRDKYYFFARDIRMHQDINDDPVVLGGWKGFFRFPVAFGFALAVTMGSVLFLAKFNPLIVYSSSYAVFAMAMSLFYFSFWLIMRGSSFVRPSALHRGFVLIWLFTFGWVAQVCAAVIEDRLNYGFMYPLAFFQSGVFVSLLITLLEQLALLRKHDFALQLHDAHQASDLSTNRASEPEPAASEEQTTETETENPEEDPTENTPLRAGEPGYGSNTQTSFADTYRRAVADDSPAPPRMRTYKPYHQEQTWSGRLPTWTWIIQFLLLAPVPCILLGNLALIAMSSLNMTGTDGGSLNAPVLALGAMSVFLLVPMTPFIHRVTHHLPMFLLCVFAGTFIYNLTAFPFSDSHRFKCFFQQRLDLDKNTNTVTITGIEEYTRKVIDALPVSSGNPIRCFPSLLRSNLQDCEFDGSAMPPNLVEGKRPDELISLKALNPLSDNKLSIQVDAVDTRVCHIFTRRPVRSFSVEDATHTDERFGKQLRQLQRINLWRRDRNRPWNVTIDFEAEDSRTHSNETKETSQVQSKLVDGQVDILLTCLWSDANAAGTVPVLDDMLRYMPTWATVSKSGVGLVEVYKKFSV